MNLDKIRITQKEIAARAGVDRSTVSLVLQGSPRISSHTQALVRRIADRLGYVPDPMLSALASYRKRVSRKVYQGTLAWVTNLPPGSALNSTPQHQDYRNGAYQRARDYGYDLIPFDLCQPAMTLARSAGVLRARGIQGLLLSPQAAPHTVLDFPWGNFSVVTFGFTLSSPILHTVTASTYRATLLVFQMLIEHGYRRIGLVLDRINDARVDSQYLAAYLLATRETSSSEIPPLLDAKNMHAFKEWFATHRPDALITGVPAKFLLFCRDCGLRVPKDIGIAFLNVPNDSDPFAGNFEESRHIGAVAVDTLVAMINRDERGIPLHPQRILIEGRWIEGKTIKGKSALQTASRIPV